MKKIIESIILTLSLFTSFALASSHTLSTDHAKLIINKLVGSDAEIARTFPGHENLLGFVMQPKKGGREIIMYADKEGRYIIVGALISKEGINLTSQDTYTYILKPLYKKAYRSAKNTHWFLQGKSNAPHTVFIIAEPNCSICHQLYKQIKPMIEKGELSVRWILVSFIKPSSLGKAAAILQSKDPAKAFDRDEAGFNTKTEAGGIPVVHKVKYETRKRLQKNLDFMQEYGFQGTPVMILKDKSGNTKVIPGLINPDELKKEIGIAVGAKG